MKIIHVPRGEGKTETLIDIAYKRRGYIVCMSHEEAERVFHRAKELKKPVRFPITFDEFLAGAFYGRGVQEFYVDNADYLIQQIGRGTPVHVMTISGTPPVNFAYLQNLAINIYCIGNLYPDSGTIVIELERLLRHLIEVHSIPLKQIELLEWIVATGEEVQDDKDRS